MNYFEILPLVKIPLSKKPYFTYKSEQSLSKGDLVQIEFGKKKIKGLVFKKTRKPRFYTKPVQKIIKKQAVDNKQWLIAEKISLFYFTPLGMVMKMFVSSINQKKSVFETETETKEFPQDKEKVALTPKQKEAVKNIQQNPGSKFLLFGPASSGKTEVLMKCIEKNIKKGRQALILLPEIFLSYQEIERYKKRFGKFQTVLLHSGLKNSEKASIRQGVATGKIDILIATRTGCFYPFKNLGFIAVEEEQDISYKQWDQTPYYHTRHIVELLADSHQADLVYSSATPSPEIYRKTLNREFRLLKLPILNKKDLKIRKPQIEIIDLKKNFKKSKTGFVFSKEMREALEKTLKSKEAGILMVPTRGKSRAVMCSDCKKILKCPNCSTGLVNIKDKFKCLHCSYKVSSITQCPSCKSFRLINLGFGTDSVAEELQNLFPQARIAVLDGTVMEKKNSVEKVFKDFSSGKLDFLVGTQVISKGFDFKNLTLVGVLNADKWMGKSDFRFDQKWLGGIFQLSGRVNRPDKDKINYSGKSIIQTYNPGNRLFSHLQNWDWMSFLEEELKRRKTFNYPPFGMLYKLTYKDKTKKSVDKKTKQVYNQIEKIIEKNTSIEVLEPYYSNIDFIRNKRIKNILLKTPRPIPKDSELGKYLTKISDDWAIDPNPENIF